MSRKVTGKLYMQDCSVSVSRCGLDGFYLTFKSGNDQVQIKLSPWHIAGLVNDIRKLVASWYDVVESPRRTVGA